MHTRALFSVVVVLLLASFLASFMHDITGQTIRGIRTSSLSIPSKQPLSFTASPTQASVMTDFQSLLVKQFPTLAQTSFTSLQKISGSSTLHARLIAPWDNQLCEETGVTKKGPYSMTGDGLTRCIQYSLTACQTASKTAAIATVKTCLTSAEQLCKRRTRTTTNAIPATFTVFEQTTDVSTNPCFLSSITTEGNGQYCFVLFTQQGTLAEPLRCQPSTKTGALQLSCSSKYVVSAAHSCKTDSVIKANPTRITY